MIIIFIIELFYRWLKFMQKILIFNYCQFNSQLLKRNIITYNVINFYYIIFYITSIFFMISFTYHRRFFYIINQTFYTIPFYDKSRYCARFLRLYYQSNKSLHRFVHHVCIAAMFFALLWSRNTTMRRFSSINVIQIAFIISIILDTTKLYPSPSFLALFSNYKSQEMLEIRGISNTSFFSLI